MQVIFRDFDLFYFNYFNFIFLEFYFFHFLCVFLSFALLLWFGAAKGILHSIYTLEVKTGQMESIFIIKNKRTSHNRLRKSIFFLSTTTCAWNTHSI